MDYGFDLVSGGTDNHLMLVDTRNFHITGKELERRLDEVYITVNKNAIPNDPGKTVCNQRYPHRYAGSNQPRHAAGRHGSDCGVHLFGGI